ncbi:YrrS family protein [Thalassobacillus pellis]|uniref:YrrS family protein n=1 Tax=Thalassobacillus pellis TaxID=748008 RepID=UPI001960DACC|nr:YrrS family protein [Thalassobacillus pellis]MBM7554679.1 cytoskeletal protein RodZ [Thalassobacillus pellis]
MAQKNNGSTRVNRFDKRRKGTKLATWLAGLGSLLILLLIAMFLFNGNEDKASDQKDEPKITISEEYQKKSSDSNSDKKESENNGSDTPSSNEESGQEDKNNSEDKQKDDKQKNDEKKKEDDSKDAQVKESDKPNVEKVITKDWSPVPTKQENHSGITYEKGTQDWQEMKQAIRKGAGLAEGDMILWWAEGNGHNKVIATATNKAETENYRVYVEWVENKGYQPTKVEVLQENDKD